MTSLIREKRRLVTFDLPTRKEPPTHTKAQCRITTDRLIWNVCSALKERVSHVKGSRRDAKYVYARSIYAYVGRELGFTLDELGKGLNKSHCTILHHSNKIRDTLDETKPWFKLETKVLIDDLLITCK